MYSKLNSVFDVYWDTYIGKSSNWDFTVSYNSKTKLTISWLPVPSLDAADIVWLIVYWTDSKIKYMYRPKKHDFFTVWNTVEVIWADFWPSDTFLIYTNLPRKKVAIIEWDVEIWAVELKDSSSTNRATIDSDWSLQVKVENIFSEIQWDVIEPSFASTTDTYVFKYNGSITATIVLTYTDSTKKVLSLITKS